MEEGRKEMKVTNTAGLHLLSKFARGSNRDVDESWLRKVIDPDGFHIMAMMKPHNDIEWRTLWLTKLNDSEEPHQIWLDIPMKGDLIERFTVTDEQMESLVSSEDL